MKTVLQMMAFMSLVWKHKIVRKSCLHLSLMLVSVLCGLMPVSGRGQSPISSAGTNPDAGQVSAPIYFRLGKSEIDPDFMGNREQMDRFAGTLRAILSNPDYVVDKVRVVGMASPDGARVRNEELAGARARALADFLLRETGIAEDKIEVVNGGENWTGLFAMIAASKELPDKDKIWEFRERYGDDYDRLKQSIQYYNGGRAWRYMYEHFFPILRTGAGGTDGDQRLSNLSITNWERTRALIRSSNIDESVKLSMLEVLGEMETNRLTDAQIVMERLHALCPDEEFYTRFLGQLVEGLLDESNAVSTDNWALLRERIATSDIEGKEDILDIIDNVPATGGREQRLRALDEGEAYRQIERLYPELLTNLSLTKVRKTSNDIQSPIETTTVSAENWRMLRAMVAESDMADKNQVLAIIDAESDPAVRERKLRELNDGYTDRYIKEVFFPELLYGISPAAKENWNLLEKSVVGSDMDNKEEVLRIMQNMPAGAEREAAIRALDDGKTWAAISRQSFIDLMQSTEQVESSGTGMSFTFEASPAAKARIEELKRREEEQRRREEEARQAEERRRLEEQRRIEEGKAREAARLAAIEHRKLKASAALKTDLMLWGSLMPGFEMGSFMPNLSAEVYFAKRWSIQLGGGYSNWDALSGDKGLYAVTGVDLEPRFWLKDDALYRGLYFGVFGTYGDFDIQATATGYTGTYFMGGVTGGWCQVLGRHLYLEAALRLGFRSAKGDNYTIAKGYWENYYWDRSENRNKFAPQLRLQLVYRFGKSEK